MPVTAVVDDFRSLTPTEQADARNEIAGLPTPPTQVLGIIWIVLVSTLCAVVLGGGFLAYLLLQDGKETAVIVGLVSGALGALIGLLAPSPKP